MILALEAFNFVRNVLIEEVGIERMGVYFVVIWNWFPCLFNPMKVPIQCLDPFSMKRRKDLDHHMDVRH